MDKVLLVGAGDIGERVIRLLAPHTLVFAVARDPARIAALEALGATVLLADLDDRSSLQHLAGVADTVIHLAPPPGTGTIDTRTQNLLAVMTPVSRPMVAQGGGVAGQCLDACDGNDAHQARRDVTVQRLVYVSTTGVYGDCGGRWVDESSPLHPGTPRAVRRVDAERQLFTWGLAHQVSVVVLRAPGIYATDRLPLARLREGTPVLRAAEDVFTNHIHAEDLASALVRALTTMTGERTAATTGGMSGAIADATPSTPMSAAYNVCDDSEIRMGDYFDLVADAFGLPRPPRVSRAQAAQRIAAPLLSFMDESRRVSNDRMKAELGIVLRYPTVREGVAAAVRASGEPAPRQGNR